MSTFHEVALGDTVRTMLRSIGSVGPHGYQREASDGHLSVIVCKERGSDQVLRWHLSISHRTNGPDPQPGRYPAWDEIADARYELLPDDVTMAMLLPPPDQYVNLHETTFHLHEIDDQEGGGAELARRGDALTPRTVRNR